MIIVVIIVYVYVYACISHDAHMESEDNLVNAVLSSYHVGSGDGTWATRLGWQRAPLLSKPSCWPCLVF